MNYKKSIFLFIITIMLTANSWAEGMPRDELIRQLTSGIPEELCQELSKKQTYTDATSFYNDCVPKSKIAVNLCMEKYRPQFPEVVEESDDSLIINLLDNEISPCVSDHLEKTLSH